MVRRGAARVSMFPWVLAGLLASGLLRAQAGANDLLAKDWRARNAAAKALADDAGLTADTLLKVLAVRWDGTAPKAIGIGPGSGDSFSDIIAVGGGKAPQADARLALERSVRKEVARRPRWFLDDSDPKWLRDRRDLVVPWHAHALAVWLLGARGLVTPAVATSLPALLDHAEEQVAVTAALVLLHASAGADVLRAEGLDHPRRAGAIVRVMWQLGGERHPELRRLVRDGPVPARRAVLGLGKPAMFAGDADARRSLAELCLDESDAEAAGHAGWLLLEQAEVPIEVLVQGLTGDTSMRRRALGFVALLGVRARSAFAAVRPLLEHGDRSTRLRAALALGAMQVDGEQAKDLFRAFTLLSREESPDVLRRLLAIDGLGSLGAAIDAETRDRLVLWAGTTGHPDVVHAALGSVVRLGAADRLPLEVLVGHWGCDPARKAVGEGLLARGAAGERALAELLLDRDWLEHSPDDLALRVPGMLRTWLRRDEPALRRIAVIGLSSLGADAGVEGARIKALLADPDSRVRGGAIRWFARLPEAGAEFDRLVVTVLAEKHHATRAAFARALAPVALPAADKLRAMDALLAAGIGWECARDADPELVRETCLRLLARDLPPRGRAEALGELARLGVRNLDELDLIRQGLRDPGSSESIKKGLWHAKVLPDVLRRDLESMVEAEGAGKKVLGTYAVEVLWAHRGSQ